MRIIPARQESLADINHLIVRSKSYWSWPEGYLEQALALQKVSPDYLSRHDCFEILDATEKLIGFSAVTQDGGTVVLDNLWVAPEWIGKGVGTRACDHVFRLARQRGWAELRVIPDPPAEGFYRKIGFFDTGERVPSRVPGGPVFSVYRIQLPAQ